MNDLINKKCVPCEGGIPALDLSEIHKYQKKVDGWDVKSNEKKIYFLEKKFKVKDFLTSQKFVNQVGEISETATAVPPGVVIRTRAPLSLPNFCASSKLSLRVPS